MHKDVKFSKKRGCRTNTSGIETKAVINTLQTAHSPSIVPLPDPVGKPFPIKSQNPVFVDVGELWLANEVARNDLIVSGLGIVVETFLANHWGNLPAIKHFHAFNAADVPSIYGLVCRAPVVDVQKNNCAAKKSCIFTSKTEVLKDV